MKRVLVIGTGGLAREFNSFFASHSDQVEIVGFSSVDADEHSTYELPGLHFKGDVSPEEVGTDQAVLAIGAPTLKRQISKRFKKLGFNFPSFIHSSSVCATTLELGEGVVVSPNCVIAPGVVLSSFSYINFLCGVGHDVRIGAYSQVNPGVQIGGGALISDSCLLGSDATVLQGVRIGKSAIVASGAVVFANVEDGVTVIGNPARRMRSFEG